MPSPTHVPSPHCPSLLCTLLTLNLKLDRTASPHSQTAQTALLHLSGKHSPCPRHSVPRRRPKSPSTRRPTTSRPPLSTPREPVRPSRALGHPSAPCRVVLPLIRQKVAVTGRQCPVLMDKPWGRACKETSVARGPRLQEHRRRFWAARVPSLAGHRGRQTPRVNVAIHRVGPHAWSSPVA